MSAPDATQIYSGRGETLTSTHQNALIELCLSSKSDKSFKDHTKKFWTRVSRQFRDRTSRPYSWQSCRRQMIKWELRSQHQAETPSPAPSSISQDVQVDTTESLNRHGRVVLPPISEFYPGHCLCHEPQMADPTDDELLPDLPLHPVRARVHGTVARSASYHNTQSLLTSLDNFEEELQAFTSSLVDKPTHRLAVENAFQNLKDEICRASETIAPARFNAENTR